MNFSKAILTSKGKGLPGRATRNWLATLAAVFVLLPCGARSATFTVPVDFIDFFMFADAFGTNDVLYDFDDSGRVDFSDFFVFADLFGAEERAKLLVMARDVLGLPTRPG
jgi:hypothetical protein